MHLLQSQLTITIEKTQIDFAEWILSIGDGTVKYYRLQNYDNQND